MQKALYGVGIVVLILGAWYLFADKQATAPTGDVAQDTVGTTPAEDVPSQDAPSADTVSAATASDMTFFVTSANPGKGADLGGLEGADAHCQTLATAAGSTGHTWQAYLSSSANGDVVNARDRIGSGPWHNAAGTLIAQNVVDLHSDTAISKQTALDENGSVINGRGDTPNQHDILTGSAPDGTAIAGSDDMTCSDWTSGADGAAMVGHHDRIGLQDDAPSKSWNSSHPSRGCSLDDLAGSGGGGFFYCFAVNE